MIRVLSKSMNFSISEWENKPQIFGKTMDGKFIDYSSGFVQFLSWIRWTSRLAFVY